MLNGNLFWGLGGAISNDKPRCVYAFWVCVEVRLGFVEVRSL
ncbi:MAG: hypothetical protein V7K53_25415 [Nostoc sp.]